MDKLTLYYDGHCGICRAEVARLRGWDRACRLDFADIAAPGFVPPPGASMRALDTEMHAQTPEGRLLIGLDSLLAAYTLVGRGWMVVPLRVPLLRPAFAALYRGLARNRYRISGWLGRPGCVDGACGYKHPLR